MNEEIEDLKNELGKTRNIVRIQRIRYQQLVSLCSAKLQEKDEETRNDLQIKHIQLTRILRALYILESKLRKEQKSLKTALLERDIIIKNQEIEITQLRTEINRVSKNRCSGCLELDLQRLENQAENGIEPKIADNKPDLISSIGIETLKDTNSRVEFEPVSNKLENEENTFVISSLDDYDASLSSLHVRGTSADETKDFPQTGSFNGVEDNQNANNENLRNRMIDEELQNEMRKFKKKEPAEMVVNKEEFKNFSPRMILKEVTENPNQKLNDPVLKCVKQILSVDNETRKKSAKNKTPENFRENSKIHERISALETSSENIEIVDYRSRHPTKPPKPNFVEIKPNFKKNERRNARFETNVSKTFLYENSLSVKPLPKIENNRSNDLLNGYSYNEDTTNELDIHKNGVKRDDFKNGFDNVADENKIVQTVSALLSDSAESEDENSETSPTVSQMVKKFEGLKSKKRIVNKQASNATKNDSMLQTNFEEFHLVDKEIESTCEDIVKENPIRLEAEGEENSITATIIETTNTSNAKYETFLEVTGLSTKSILTPSRILSNHRNVVKPKDVKYRSRVKAAAFGEKCSNGSTVTSPTMKYWTEPYL